MLGSSDLEIGVRFQMFGDEADPKRFKQLARSAEDNEFDIIVGGDHITFPVEMAENYYGSDEGPPDYMNASSNAYDLFETLSFLAGVTESINLGTNVAVAPYRHPVLLAKNALTLDALSQGRFEFGVAAGWLRTEFEVLGVPFEERGERLDEFLRIYVQACEKGEISFEGAIHSFEETGFYPLPSDKPPKLWIGGLSGPAFRRVAEFGDGWTISRQTPEEIASSRKRIMNAWGDYNRSGEPKIAVRNLLHVGADGPTYLDRAVMGSADNVISQLQQFVDAGATRFLMTFYTDSLEEQLEQLERVGNDIIPCF